LDRPAQDDRPLLKRILALRALGVLQNLANRRLPDIKISIPLQMTRVHFLVGIGFHHVASCCWPKIIAARMFVTSKRIASETSCTIVDGVTRVVSFEDKHVDQACIQAVMPCRRNRVRPRAIPRPEGGTKASRRSCS